MNRKLFVNIAVRDLQKSKDFFSALGFTFNPQFTDEKAACMVISDDAYFRSESQALRQHRRPRPAEVEGFLFRARLHVQSAIHRRKSSVHGDQRRRLLPIGIASSSSTSPSATCRSRRISFPRSASRSIRNSPTKKQRAW